MRKTGRLVIPRRSLHDELLERLRDLITSGALAPGERIPEKELCAQFAVSRTPLREALKVLASEGIVTLTPNRGASVSTLTIEEMEQMFPVGGALEALSGELACVNATDAELHRINVLHADMVEQWKAGKLQAYFRLNQAIHEAIMDAAHNDILKATYRSLSARMLPIRYIAGMSAGRWAEAVAEHEAMMAALNARDGGKLAEILRTHVGATKLATVKEWLGQTGELPAVVPPVMPPPRRARRAAR